MGRYVLLEFDDDAQADNLIARINAAKAAGKKYGVIGVFQKPPRKRCECIAIKVGGKTNEVKRHKLTGFHYCTRCKRVRKGWQSPRNMLDDPKLAFNFFSLGQRKEASLYLDQHGRPIKNFPITDALDGTRP